MFEKESEAEQAQQNIFNTGYESPIEQGQQEEKEVYLIQLPQVIDFTTDQYLDMIDQNGKRFFPEQYKKKIVYFDLIF